MAVRADLEINISMAQMKWSLNQLSPKHFEGLKMR